ncbi:RNA polymerase sigma factor [Sphingobacterium tabacisoli]|uniref:RNA polymerase sigma factor n=1 Tax=Sphingobacterium tabacisoli TaxID=2044855 RepID=A0ABW5KZ05_9SPHI|nr:sigma-70 family RNA polymerase sigma factor [Sphingobacterium tabacisoli]
MEEVSGKDFIGFQNGNEKVFKRIFEQYYRTVFNYAYGFCKNKHDAEEVTQETFTKLFLYRKRLLDDSNMLPFLLAVSKRIAISLFRKKVIRENSVADIRLATETVSHNTKETIYNNELHTALEKIIAELPIQQQRVFVLNKMEDLSYQEIADQMGISKNTVKNHLIVASKSVRIKLQKLLYIFL